MKINGLVFVPDSDHDWVHVIDEQTKEQFKYNENISIGSKLESL